MINSQSYNFISISVLLVIIIVYSRYNNKKRRQIKRSDASHEDDFRENIVTYTDEEGEHDMKAYDLTSLRIQISANNCNVIEKGMLKTQIPSKYSFQCVSY